MAGRRFGGACTVALTAARSDADTSRVYEAGIAGRARSGAIALACSLLLVAAVLQAARPASGATSSTVVTATVPSATTLDATACAAGAADVTDFGIVMPGSSAVTGTDCVVLFGSSNDTSMLLAYQTDQGGDAMRPAPTVGTLAMWTMNGSLKDYSVVGNDGDPLPSAPNDPSYVAGGPGRGQALSFDGNDYATIPSNAAYNTNSFTVDAWIRTSDVSDQVIAAREDDDCGSGGLCQWELFLNGGLFQPEIEVGSNWKGGTGSFVADGNWHHVAMTVDDTTKELRAYVDGAQVAIDSNWSTGSPDSGTIPIILGTSATSSNDFTGEVDELRHQPGVLTPADIRRYYLGRVQDYADGSMDWDTPIATTSMFGVCLDSAADGAATDLTTFTANAGCPKTDGAGWRALAPTSVDPTAKVAITPSGDFDATAHLRFGFRPSTSQPAGTYEAPITFEVIAPAA